MEPPEIFQPKVVELCAESGVAMVFIPQLPRLELGLLQHDQILPPSHSHELLPSRFKITYISLASFSAPLRQASVF